MSCVKENQKQGLTAAIHCGIQVGLHSNMYTYTYTLKENDRFNIFKHNIK